MANDLRKVLDAIDGTSSVDALQSKLNFRSADWLDRALAALVADEMICEAEHSTGLLDFTSVEPSVQSDDSERKAQDLRAKIKARREGGERSPPGAGVRDQESEEKTRKLAEEKALREAADRARQEAEAQARKLAEEKALREAADRARQEAEAQTRKLAEEKALREAAERARQEAEAQARKLAEEKALREAADRARQEAEAQARKLAEEKALREAVERARQEAEEQVRRETEDRVRREAEEAASREAEERVRRETEDRIRREAEETASREAEEAASREAEERVRRETEDRIRRETEETASREAEERIRRETEDRIRRETEERVRQEAEAEAQRAVEDRVRQEAEDKAWRKAEEKSRSEEEKLARKRVGKKEPAVDSGKSLRWGKPVALGLLALIVLGLVAIHLISFDGQIPQFEKALAGQFQQPVKIKGLRLSLLPQTHLRLEGVAIGAEGQIRVSGIKAVGGLGNLFNDKKVFKSIELDSPVVTEEGLGWILFGKPLAQDVAFGQVGAVNARLESKNVSLPAVDAKLQSDGEGAWKTVVIESVDKNINLELTRKGETVQIDFKARSFKIPFGSDLTLDDLVASGTAERNQLAVTEFKSFSHGGILGGSARLKWGSQWTLAGELNAKQIDTSRLLPGLIDGARLAGVAAYAMQAADATKLFAANRVEGNFVLGRGTLLGVDLGRMLQGGTMSGETRFAEIAGNFVHDRGATQLKLVRLTEGGMSANGAVDVDASKNVRGRFAVDLKLPMEQRRASLAVSGTLTKVEWRR
jgi:hypothetical protein